MRYAVSLLDDEGGGPSLLSIGHMRHMTGG
jgi:hypothetical protein